MRCFAVYRISKLRASLRFDSLTFGTRYGAEYLNVHALGLSQNYLASTDSIISVCDIVS